MNNKYPRMSKLLAAMVVAAVLAGCGKESPDKLIASAKEYLAKNDSKAAIIQIKNALQVNPNLGEARFLLGDALLKSGDPASAEVELSKAIELEYNKDAAYPLLAKALLMQGKHRKLVDEVTPAKVSAPTAKAEVLTAVAMAQSALGKPDLARTALDAALAADGEFADALLLQARQKAGSGDAQGALAIADRVLAKSPKNHEALRLKGDVQLVERKDADAALKSYREAVQAKPDYLLGYTSLMAVLIARQDMTEANTTLEQMKKIAPAHPQTRYFEAQLAYLNKDFKRARELSQQVLKASPDNARVLQLAGAVEFQLNALVQAEAYLSKAVQAAPDSASARRLLILTYLRNGQLQKALGVIPANLLAEGSDAELLSAAGQVYLQANDAKRAEQFFARAAKLDPQDARKRTSLAVAHMRTGQADSAFAELQDIAASDKGTTADLALISAYLSRREVDKALKAIDALEKKQPNEPMPANLRGLALMAKRDNAGARKSFEQALAINPAFLPAASSLAALDMGDKKPEEARKRFENVLAKDPRNVQALVALADLRSRTGATREELAELLNKAIAANSGEAPPRLLLIDFHLRAKEYKQALSAAQSAVAAVPDNADLLDALGRVQLASGDYNQALASFNKMVGLQPQSPMPYMRMAGVHMAEKKTDAAVQSLRKALEIQPDYLEAQRGLVSIYAGEKKYDDAIAVARTVQKQRPKESVGFVLEGDVAAAQKKPEQAVAVYRSALAQLPDTPELAVNLHASLLASGKTADADKLAAGWFKDHPKDAAFRQYLGDTAITRSDWATAEKHYLGVIQLQPNNAMALNNLAWVSTQLKKDGALAYAERANAIAPNQAAFMDTLATVLADKGDFDKAIATQERAMKLQPDNPGLRLGLARIYVKAGKKEQAKKELDALAAMGDKFHAQGEVARLAKTL